MKDDTTITPFHQPGSVIDPLTEIAREGARARRGIEVVVADDPDCVALMTRFIADRSELWSEDIAED